MGPPRSASCRRLARHRVGKLVITMEQQISRIALALHLVTEARNQASGFRTSTDITRNTIQDRMLVVIEHTTPKELSDSKSVEFDSQSDSGRLCGSWMGHTMVVGGLIPSVFVAALTEAKQAGVFEFT